MSSSWPVGRRSSDRKTSNGWLQVVDRIDLDGTLPDDKLQADRRYFTLLRRGTVGMPGSSG